MSTESNPPGQPRADRSTDLPTPPLLRWMLTGARLTMLIGIVSLLIGAITLLAFGVVQTYSHVVKMATPSELALTNVEIFLASIKLVDLVLLATILQVVAFGLYSLFIDSRIPLPRWLRTSDVDDLKFKLAGIVAVMLGVLFLEQVVHWSSDRDLMPLGLAIAAVIIALSYFIRSHSE